MLQSEPSLRDRRRLHESAHAIVSEVLGLRVHELFAEPVAGLGGGCVHQVHGDVDDAPEAEKVLLVCLAGQEAERQVCPSLWGLDSVPGCGTDDQDASDMAARLARIRGVDRHQALRDGSRRARELVERHWGSIVALAGSLAWAGDRLTGVDLSEALRAAALGCRYRRPSDGPLFGSAQDGEWPRLPASGIAFSEEEIEQLIHGSSGRFHRQFESVRDYQLAMGGQASAWRALLAAGAPRSMATAPDTGVSFGQVKSAVRQVLDEREAAHAS